MYRVFLWISPGRCGFAGRCGLTKGGSEAGWSLKSQKSGISIPQHEFSGKPADDEQIHSNAEVSWVPAHFSVMSVEIPGHGWCRSRCASRSLMLCHGRRRGFVKILWDNVNCVLTLSGAKSFAEPITISEMASRIVFIVASYVCSLPIYAPHSCFYVFLGSFMWV